MEINEKVSTATLSKRNYAIDDLEDEIELIRLICIRNNVV